MIIIIVQSLHNIDCICSSVVHSMTLVTDIDEDLSLEIAPQIIYHLVDKYV